VPAPPSSAPAATDVPLCVDLDGTLIHSDMLWESFARVLRTRPWRLLLAPWWLAHGRARLKRELATGTPIDVATLPYNDALLAHLRTEKARGRRVLLVTASEQELGRRVADHVRLFDETLGSDGVNNLRSHRKAAALVARFGEKGYDYAGNSPPDLAVWARGRAAVIVNARPALAARARAAGPVAGEFPGPANTSAAAAWWTLLRPQRWVKNLLVFVPLIASRQFAQVSPAVAAFGALCLASSGAYILNDLLDLEVDRRDATKRTRPLAAGLLPLSGALLLAPALFAAALAITAGMSTGLVATLGGFVALAAAYSWGLKRVPLLGVLALAGLYLLRVVAGFACAA
jgi:hypothetical protein